MKKCNQKKIIWHFFVNNSEECEEIQKYAFNLGYVWHGGGTEVHAVNFLKVLFFENQKNYNIQ